MLSIVVVHKNCDVETKLFAGMLPSPQLSPDSMSTQDHLNGHTHARVRARMRVCVCVCVGVGVNVCTHNGQFSLCFLTALNTDFPNQARLLLPGNHLRRFYETV